MPIMHFAENLTLHTFAEDLSDFNWAKYSKYSFTAECYYHIEREKITVHRGERQKQLQTLNRMLNKSTFISLTNILQQTDHGFGHKSTGLSYLQY